MAADIFPLRDSVFSWPLRADPRCHRCDSNVCLVVYRRNGGNEVWECARCASVPVAFRVLSKLGPWPTSVLATIEPPEPRPPRREPRPEPMAEMRRRYMGPRARHDPLR